MWAPELKKCWSDALSGRRRSILRVDLTGVTSIDPKGEACLSVLHRRSAEFIAPDCLMKALVEEIAQASD